MSILGRASFEYHRLRVRAQARMRAMARPENTLATQVCAFNARRVIFTVTAGRTGSQTLSRIMNHVPDAVALHEPRPQYSSVMREAVRSPWVARRFMRHVKMPAILSLSQTIYIETSHLFCKGFLEPALALGLRPALIFLERDLRETAVSLLHKTAVPGRSREGRQYLMAPDDLAYVAIRDHAAMSDYQLCYWYCLEISHRQQLYRQLADRLGLDHFTIRTQELNDEGRISALLDHFGLAADGASRDNLLATLGVRHNASRDQLVMPERVDEAEAEVEARITGRATLDEVVARINALTKSGGW